MKYGIIGGTFNPIHIGHLVLAEEVRQKFALDKVFFVPSGIPPHKLGAVYASADERLEMTRLAARGNDSFEVLDIEVRREGYSYTIDTVRALKRMYAADEFFFVTGADAVTALDTWHNFEELAKEVTFAGASRAGVSDEKLVAKTDFLKREYGFAIELVETPLIAISSSEIRRRVMCGASIRYFVPEAVERYIRERALYLSRHALYDKMSVLAKNRLSERRFRHSLGVAAEARRIARLYGVDHEKAELAGLVHDYCKEISVVEARECIARYGITEYPCITKKPLLAHGEIAAGMLREEGLITDEEVLDAVRWHTYGNGDMSALAKIVYIADIVDPTRGDFEGKAEVLEALETSLDAAILAWRPHNEKFLSTSSVHPNTERMYRRLTMPQ